MAELPTMSIRTDALLGDTGHLSATEFGAYVRLLLAMWRNGAWLPADPKRLARYATLTAGQWARSGPTLMEFFIEAGDGRITQGRLADEYRDALAKSSTAADNSNARWRRRTAGRVAVEQQAGLPSNSPDNDIPNKALENNDTGDAPALPPDSGRNALHDPRSSKKIHGGDSAREDVLHDEIVVAAGGNPANDVHLRFIGSKGKATVAAWRADLGLSQTEILTVVRETMARKRDGPPASLSFFDRPMRAHAGLKQAAPLTPIPPSPAGDLAHVRPSPSRSERETDAWLAGASLQPRRTG